MLKQSSPRPACSQKSSLVRGYFLLLYFFNKLFIESLRILFHFMKKKTTKVFCKAVVARTASAGPLFWTSMLSAVSLFSRLAHFSLCLPLIFNLLMQSSIKLVARVIHRRPSQGVKTLKNNAIIIMTVIILTGRVERKPDVVVFEN